MKQQNHYISLLASQSRELQVILRDQLANIPVPTQINQGKKRKEGGTTVIDKSI